MIHYSKLGRYVNNLDVIYAFKIISFDRYEVTYIPGSQPFEKTLMNQDSTNELIDSLINDGFTKLNPVSIIDLQNKKEWAELTLEHYNKIIPATPGKNKKVKI